MYLGAQNCIRSMDYIKNPPATAEEINRSASVPPPSPMAGAVPQRVVQEQQEEIDALKKQMEEMKAKTNLMDKFLAKANAMQGVTVNPSQPIKKGDKECKICTASFSSTAMLKRHDLKVHQGAGNYHCPDCDKTFMSSSSQKAHSDKVHKGEGVKCEEEGCPKVFTTRRAMVCHLKTHQPPEDLECPHCKDPFERKRYLDEHMPSCAKNPERDEFLCPQCGRPFHQKKHLSKHMRDDH
jgi:uncharacterized C2H2 Zn-finger protein